jgi:hypothetical protein
MWLESRADARATFVEVWAKMNRGAALAPMESLIAEVITMHPEYHARLRDREVLSAEFPPEQGESNPFLHMGMHIALKEQQRTDRPPGVADAYRRIVQRSGDAHEAEHRMIECLARSLWEAQRARVLPDEEAYLDCLRRL